MRTTCGLLAALFVLSSCASRHYQAQALATVSEAEGKACEAFAEAEAASVEGRSVFEDGFCIVFFVPCLLTGILPLGMLEVSVENARMRQPVYDAALRGCLEPVILEQTLGAEDPRVARSLSNLAARYAARGKEGEADSLYKRALAIYEKAASPHDSEVVSMLENYAALLRKMNRLVEAEQTAVRAKAILGKQAQ